MGNRIYMNNKKRNAFTLTEILISILILGLIMGAVIGLFFAIVMHLQQSDDITTAQQRGEMVLTALGPKILAAGLGMPENASFDQFSDLDPSWSADVMLTGSNELTIIYAVPTDAIVSGEKSLSLGVAVSIDLTGTIPPNTELKNLPSVVAGWVVFPAARVALSVNDASPQSAPLVLVPEAEGKIYGNDRLHLVRAVRAKVDNEKWFVMTDLKTAPEITRQVVEGIADIRFYLDTPKKNVTVKVLARGNQRHDSVVSPSTLPDWVDEPYKNKINIDAEDQHYRLKVVQRTWGLRNQ